jgi:hypothetical protein
VNGRLVSFVGGPAGPWRVLRLTAPAGEPLPEVERLDVVPGALPAPPPGGAWVLRGITSNERYVTGAEKDRLAARQPPLGRAGGTRATLIPIRKSAAWGRLAQDERRRILEERSRHVATGLRHLPAVARRLHHSRDLGEAEPFDELTWFEFAADDAPASDALLAERRASEEWAHVEREVEVRLVRDGA